MTKEFYDMRVRTILTLVVMIAIFLSVAPLHNYAIKMLEEHKGELRGFNINIEALKNWNIYIYSQWFGKNFGQFIPIIAIIFAFPLFSREYENKTIEFLLTRMSRGKVFLNKFLAAAVNLSVEIAILSFLPLIYSVLFSKPLSYNLIWEFLIQSEVGGFLWFSLALLFSVIFDDQVKPLITVLGILALSIAFGFIRPLSFLNTYPYILGSNVLRGLGIDITRTAVFLTISSVLVSFSCALFIRKEI
ncbi:MAG: ABC transporter permease subunit [Thermotogaceae bacterium]|nr:ABC transporter permease subunit [Thermotogaceae bacterium]